ncbi:hypothetical protein RB213_001406 [Colletotrichum asianum]
MKFIRSSREQIVVTLPPETIAIAIAKQTSSTGPPLIRLRWRLWQDSTSFTPSNNQLPTDLNIKLHVNHRDLSLPDNHRQI